MNPDYGPLSEGVCPTDTSHGPLERTERADGGEFGFCYRCDEGWSIENGRVFLHVVELHEDGTGTHQSIDVGADGQGDAS